jgi:hypothetical protein
VSHTFYREGDEIMSKNIKIENYIDFNGEMVLHDALPEEQQKETGKKIHDRMMESAGYIIGEKYRN